MRRIGIKAGMACAGVVLAGMAGAVPAQGTPGGGGGVSGAISTTVNTGADGDGHCLNGDGAPNCNIYDAKDHVWLNGLPDGAALEDGQYFFAVLAPGGQGANSDANPNDGTAKNLSDDFDTYADRTFTVSGGVLTYAGPHDVGANKIRLAPYIDTPNPGGEYILAVCEYDALGLDPQYLPGVDPSVCKYDAFKVRAGDDGGVGGEGDPEPAEPPVVTKDAAGHYTTTWTWGVAKSADRTLVKKIGGTATVNYTVAVTHDGGTDSDVGVTGTIKVENHNVDGNGDVVAMGPVAVTDVLSDGTVCTVEGGAAVTLTAAETQLPYSCTLSAVPDPGITNTATVTWGAIDLADGRSLDAGSTSFTFPTVADAVINFEQTKVDDCAAVTDTAVAGGLGTLCAGDPSPTSYTYPRTLTMPRWDCQDVANRATVTTDDSGTAATADRTVTLCGPAQTGAHTMGFWQNKNGQAILKGGAATAGVCNSGTWLRGYRPFEGLSATASCATVASWVTTVIKSADASGASMNAMLKGQMLATALSVYFSDPALGGNKIGAPGPAGAVKIDLTMVPPSGNVSAAFGGASALTVKKILACASAASNSGGGTWYANVKATQEKAKNTFDGINNQVVFPA